MNTIPGGAYQNPDGSWIDANGKPIPAPRGPIYEVPEPPVIVTEAEIPQIRSAIPPGEEYATPPEPLFEGEAPKARRSTKKS